MLRRTYLVAALGLVLALVARRAAADPKENAKEVKANPLAGKVAPYVHVVIFRLHKEAPAGTTEALIQDAHALLAKIPSVRRLWVGRPADKATPITQKDYPVGLLVLFDNAEGLHEYLEHPLHLQFIARHGKNVDSKTVNIYDFANQAK